jgi:site-specific recombinase XerD
LQREEIRELFAVCEADTGSIGVRDAALLAIILGCGLRRSEAVALSYEDIEPADRALKILGKGNKERLAYVPDGAWQRLQFWVDQVRGTGAAVSAHPPARRGDGVPAHRPGGVPYPPGSPASGRAGKCAPHDLRRTFATAMLDNGEDLITVKDAMGHASVTTTQKYDRRGEERLRRARNSLDIIA